MPKVLGNSKPRTSRHLTNQFNSKHKFNSNKDMQLLVTSIRIIKSKTVMRALIRKWLQSCNQDI